MPHESPVRPDNDPVPLLDGRLDDVLGQGDVTLQELLLGRPKVLLELLDELEALPDVGLEPAVVEGAGDDLLLGVLLQGEGDGAQLVGTPEIENSENQESSVVLKLHMFFED